MTVLGNAGRNGLWRSRWAAFGAGLAVAVGGGGLFSTNAAAPSSEFVAVAPTRVLDTRGAGLGLVGKFVTDQARLLTVTGVVATSGGNAEVVPAGATGVVLNVTVLGPSAGGFFSVRPGDATGSPSTSNLNFSAGVVVPNSVTVALPAAGNLNLFFHSNTAGATTDLLIDIVGYYGGGSTVSLGATASFGRLVQFSTTQSTANGDGVEPSIAIGVDGFAIIAHTDTTGDDLRVTHCNDHACGTATSTSIDTGNAGDDASIAIGTDGLPIIAHRNAVGGDLKVSHCNDLACTSATNTTVDNPGGISVGFAPSITIGADGLAIVSHFEFPDGDLRVTHCDNVACTADTTTEIDTTGDVGRDSSITIGVDELAIIAHNDSAPNNDLRVSHCNNLACTSATNSTVDTFNSAGGEPSIAIGVDGLAIIAHRESSVDDLRMTHCSDVACTAATSVTIDSGVDAGRDPSITIGFEGYPIVAQAPGATLQILRCGNIACTVATSQSFDLGVNAGQEPSIAIGSDGQLIVATSNNVDLIVTKLQQMSWTRNGWES